MCGDTAIMAERAIHVNPKLQLPLCFRCSHIITPQGPLKHKEHLQHAKVKDTTSTRYGTLSIWYSLISV